MCTTRRQVSIICRAGIMIRLLLDSLTQIHISPQGMACKGTICLPIATITPLIWWMAVERVQRHFNGGLAQCGGCVVLMLHFQSEMQYMDWVCLFLGVLPYIKGRRKLQRLQPVLKAMKTVMLCPLQRTMQEVYLSPVIDMLFIIL